MVRIQRTNRSIALIFVTVVYVVLWCNVQLIRLNMFWELWKRCGKLATRLIIAHTLAIAMSRMSYECPIVYVCVFVVLLIGWLVQIVLIIGHSFLFLL